MGNATRPPRLLFQVAVPVLAALAVILLTDWNISGPQSTLDVEGPVAESQRDLFHVTLWVTLFIFVTVGGALAYAQIRFRARATDSDDDPPEQTHGHPVVEVGLIIASTLLLVIIAIPTVKGIWYTNDTPDRENALVVRVTGYQWWFKFDYPDLGITTANEMVIPTDRPVHIELRTLDVIHSFWVPKLAGKVDLMPNRANHMWLQADESNYYWAQCAEYCGESHANMKFRVVSLDEAEFTGWVERQRAEARTVEGSVAEAEAMRPRVRFAAATDDEDSGMVGSTSPFAYWQFKQADPAPGSEDPQLIAHGRELFLTKTCGSCHTVRGHNHFGIRGPDLTHFASRTTIAAAMMDNTPANLKAWIAHPNTIKPGNIMWRDGYVANNVTLTDDDVAALAAYLNSLK